MSKVNLKQIKNKTSGLIFLVSSAVKTVLLLVNFEASPGANLKK